MAHPSTGELRTYGFQTVAVHGGAAADPATGARAVPIYQTTAFSFQNTAHAAELFSLDEAGNIYTRIMNPTTDVLEKRVALLEGGVAAVAFASGQAATSAVIFNVARAGDEVVASSHLYGGTHTLLTSTLADLGIRVRLVQDLWEAKDAFSDRTRLVLVETLGNPKLHVADLRAWAELAHAHGVPLAVDNTFATPYLCRPIDHGADIVIHSATKWLGGHGTAMGGIVVDGGRFDYDRPTFPQFSEPDASYHGLRYAREMGGLAFSTRIRVKLLRDLGGAISPFNAFLILQGVETLALRMDRACATALDLAERLSQAPGVSWVNYPGLANHPSRALANQYLAAGRYGAVLNFGIEGGVAAGRAFIDRLGLWSHVANVGDVRSLVIHPASTTHQQLTADQQLAAGADPDLVRLSVGLEDPEDLWNDLEQAIAHATRGTAPARRLNDEGVIREVAERSVKPDGTPVTIAVVGLSAQPGRPSYRVARKLRRLGYRIVGVNPAYAGQEILGEPCVSTLEEVPHAVDVVQVFRGAEHAPAIAREAASHSAPVFWLQEGVISDEAAQLAHAAGKWVVMNRCVFKEVQRIRGPLATYPR
jgi:O-acetylhomoserine (thiol)-lyase